MRAWATELRTNAASTIPGRVMSATNCARPASSGPSSRRPSLEPTYAALG